MTGMPAAARGVRGSLGRGLAGVAAAGLALRVVYVTVLTPHLQGRGDSSYYHQLGTLIADGRGFVDPGNGTPTALHPPLFPLVLALGRELGLTSYRADRLVVCVLGTAAIVAVGLLAGANCHDTYYGRDIGSWQIACVPPGPVIDESVAAAHFRSAGLRYARKHTSRLLLVVPARLARTFELLQPLRQARHAEGRAYWIEVAGAIGFYLVAAGGLAGAVGLRRRGEGLAILLAPVGLAVLASAIGYGVPRFRHPADIALVVLAAVALSAAPLARVSRGRGSAEPPGPARRWPRRALAREPGRGPAA